MVYFDHAAATPVDPKVQKAMEPYLFDAFFNPSSPYAPAVGVRRVYEEAKHNLARAIGASAADIVITAGATESINLAIRGVGGHVVTTSIEHHAVLNTAKQGDVTIVPVNEKGLVDLEALRAAIRPDTRLVSVALANNEIGTVQPLRRIAEMIGEERSNRRESGDTTPLFLHSDASQGVGQLDVNVSRLGVDLLTLNSAKIYGPKQMGLLWASSEVSLAPEITGGGQERGLRSGTENVAGVVGFAKAMELMIEHRNYETERIRALRDEAQRRLMEAFPEAVVSGHQKHRLAGHLHISFPAIDAERLIFALEAEHIYVATGSACAANKGTRSHVLDAIGLPVELADGSLRLTFGHLTTEYNVPQAIDKIIKTIRAEYDRLGRAQ